MSWTQAMFWLFLGGFVVALVASFIWPREGLRPPHSSTDRKRDAGWWS